MFRLEDNILYTELPQGKTNEELVEQAISWVRNNKEKLYGKEVKINGRLTVPMALALGHELAHITKSVSMFDPKENKYVKVIWH